MGKVMRQMALLTKRAEILFRVVRRIVIQMRRREHDLREVRGLQQRQLGDDRGLPQHAVAASIPAMAGAAEFALPGGSIKSDCAADFCPVGRIQRLQFGSDWHFFFDSFPPRFRRQNCPIMGILAGILAILAR